MREGKKRRSREVDAAVGARLRIARKERGLSQEKLGDALGVSFQQVQKYENGTNALSAARLVQIADVLGRSPSYFFGESDPAGAAGEDKNIITRMLLAGGRGVTLAEAFLSLPGDLQNKAADLVCDIAVLHRDAQGSPVRQEAA